MHATKKIIQVLKSFKLLLSKGSLEPIHHHIHLLMENSKLLFCCYNPNSMHVIYNAVHVNRIVTISKKTAFIRLSMNSYIDNITIW